jgi:2,6-dihydroxypyridine 3-monooxygenase
MRHIQPESKTLRSYIPGSRPRSRPKLREQASDLLAPPIAELALGVEEPFVQAIFDIQAPQMAFGRTCLLGDAAFAARPYAAAGTAKAAEDGWVLGE